MNISKENFFNKKIPSVVVMIGTNAKALRKQVESKNYSLTEYKECFEDFFMAKEIIKKNPTLAKDFGLSIIDEGTYEKDIRNLISLVTKRISECFNERRLKLEKCNHEELYLIYNDQITVLDAFNEFKEFKIKKDFPAPKFSYNSAWTAYLNLFNDKRNMQVEFEEKISDVKTEHYYNQCNRCREADKDRY